MAAWHVPVHDESVSEDILEDDLFEDNLEQTFPPLRYCAINQTRRPSKKLRRDSSRERERLYRELVGHAPYVVKQQSPRDDRFYIALDVKHYKPEEITIKVDGKIRAPSERLIDVQLVSFFPRHNIFFKSSIFFPAKKTWSYPAGSYMFKVNNRNTRTRCENMFKVNNKETRTTSLASFWCLYC